MSQEIKINDKYLIQAYAYDENENKLIKIEDFYFDNDCNLYSKRQTKIKIIKPNYHTDKSRPTVIIHHMNRKTFRVENLIIASFYIKSNATIKVGDKEYNYATLIKNGWGVIYKDGNYRNYSLDNMELVKMESYLKWCRDTNHRPHLSKPRRDYILKYAKKTNNSGWGQDAILLANKFYLDYKSIRRIMQPITGKAWSKKTE